MLPPGRRIRRAEDFWAAVRSGVRAGRSRLVVHLALTDDSLHGLEHGLDHDLEQACPASAGFVVSRAVGGAVQRNRVRRRLRHLVAERLHDLPDGALLVVRALPPAADAGSATLGSDLDHALASALRSARRRPSSGQRTPSSDKRVGVTS